MGLETKQGITVLKLGHFRAFQVLCNHDRAKMLLCAQPDCLGNAERFVDVIAGHKLLA